MGTHRQTEGYERALVRLEAALELALAERAEREDPRTGQVRSHLGAALAEISSGSGLPVDLELARTLARRMAMDPLASLKSQKSYGGYTLRTLLLD